MDKHGKQWQWFQGLLFPHAEFHPLCWLGILCIWRTGDSSPLPPASSMHIYSDPLAVRSFYNGDAYCAQGIGSKGESWLLCATVLPRESCSPPLLSWLKSTLHLHLSSCLLQFIYERGEEAQNCGKSCKISVNTLFSLCWEVAICAKCSSIECLCMHSKCPSVCFPCPAFPQYFPKSHLLEQSNI